MRKAIAIFIIWLVATISIPYSHIFSVALHGFALPEIVWAQGTYTAESCEFASGPRCGPPDSCCRFGDVCKDSTTATCETPSSTGSGPAKICERQSPVNPSIKNVQCFPNGCVSGWSETSNLEQLINAPNGFRDLSTCRPNLAAYIATIDRTIYNVQGPASDGSYTITDLQTACQKECEARSSTTTTLLAMGGQCSPVQPPAELGKSFTKLTGNLCPQGQSCYCVYINPQQFFGGVSTSGQLPGGFNTASLPGSGGLAEDPAQIKNPPRFAANELDCNAPTNATIKANISLSTAPVGTLVTVSGSLDKLTNACKGVSYSCRRQYQVGCRVQQGFFSTCVKYNSCNAGDAVVYQSGSQCSINWLAIIGLILIAVSIYGAFVDKAVAAKISAAVSQARAFITLFQSRSQDTFYAGGCNSICGQNTGDTPMTAAPTCNGYPIAAKEGLYQCRLGTCGGYEQKDVLIEIKDSSGKVMKSDKTRTDDFGAFSYTFPAPGPAGTYLIVVSTDNPLPVLFNMTTS